MKILFIDTETSALSPQKGQIIEIAGVIRELDTTTLKLKTLGQFEELIKFRSDELDERVTRITGLTIDDLNSAKSITQVQELWANWLEKWNSEKIMIVGHSIDFDLGFLKNENWYLPDNYSSLDTLETVKVLYPEVSAINLEFLVTELDLLNKYSKSDDLSTMSAHRALYDTFTCAYLFEECLQKLQDTKAHTIFYKHFTEYFGLQELQFYGEGVVQDKPIFEYQNNRIGFDGEIIKPNIFQKIKRIGSTKHESQIIEFINSGNIEYPTTLKLVILQLYIINLQSSKGRKELKFHGRTSAEFTFFELLIDLLIDENITDNKEYFLGNFESVITSVRQLSERQFNLTKLITLLEIYNYFDDTNLPVQKTISAYDFLLITIQPFWVRSEYIYKPFDIKPQESVIRLKIGQLSIALKELYNLNWKTGNSILKSLVENIQMVLNELKDGESELFIRSNNQLNFRFWSGQMFVGKQQPNFRLNNSIEKLLIEKNPTISTYFNEDDFWKFLEITGMKRVLENYPKIEYLNKDLDFILSLEELPLSKYFIDKISLAKTQNKPVLILCGQNSGLRDAEKILPFGNFDKKDYLILGDTGSLTKIASKITLGFTGVVVVKTNDYDYFVRSGVNNWGAICILCAPYFAMDNYWWNLAKASGNKEEYLKIFKYMYLKSLASKINVRSGITVNYQRSYSTK
jgi:DNA polymerase III epsilon subunit-like protein